VLTERTGRVTSADGQTDADVIERSRIDPGCFGAIFDRHAEEILRYAHARLGPDLGDALTIRPSRIPAGDSILIEVSWYPGDGRLGGNVGDRVLGNDNPPTCTPAR
jgi:hypothetical protein